MMAAFLKCKIVHDLRTWLSLHRCTNRHQNEDLLLLDFTDSLVSCNGGGQESFCQY